MAIKKTDKGNYYLVTADSGKLKVKGDDKVYSQATELKDKPREYEEIKDQANLPKGTLQRVSFYLGLGKIKVFISMFICDNLKIQR